MDSRFQKRTPAGTGLPVPPAHLHAAESEDDEEEEESEDDVSEPGSSEEEEVDSRFAKRHTPAPSPAGAAAHRHSSASQVESRAQQQAQAQAQAQASELARRRAAEAQQWAQAERDAAAAARRSAARDSDEDEDEEDEEDDDDDEDEDETSGTDTSTSSYQPRTSAPPPALRFSLATFSSSFDPALFVSDLTRDLFAQQSSGDFDPAPFQSLFDAALDRLRALRDETDKRILAAARTARQAEDTHRETLASLSEQHASLLSKFRRLDGRISAVAHTAVRIGHTLQQVDAQKRANLAGQDIIQHFLAFNEGDRAKLPPIFSTSDPAELHRAAALIQTLSHISQDIRVKGTERATELIAKTSNDIENQLISRFDAASRNGQLMEMKSCAATLLNFRGRSIIKRYVFNVIEKLETYTHSSKGAEGKGAGGEEVDDRSVFGRFHSSLTRLYRGVVLSLKEQCAVCAVIFPHPLAVIKAILERVFQDKVQGLIDAQLGDRKVADGDFLRMLDFAHTATEELVKQLLTAIRSISQGVTHRGSMSMGAESPSSTTSPISPMSSSSITSPPFPALGAGVGNGLMSPLGPGGGVPGLSSASLSGEPSHLLHLHDQVSGIFGSYRAQYLARESALMEHVCDRHIREVLELEPPRPRPLSQHARTGASGGGGDGGGAAEDDGTDLFGRVRKEIVADQKQKWVLLVLEQPLVDRLTQHCTLALQRCDRLSDPSALADNVAQLFLHVAVAVLEQYIQPILDRALEFLPPPEPRQEPDPFMFQVIGLCQLVADKLQLHYSLHVAPRVASDANTQLIVGARVRELFASVEQQLSVALVRCLQSQVRYIARLLSDKQRRNDYRPRDDDAEVLLDGKPSDACEAVCESVRNHYQAVHTCLDGKNLDKFLLVSGLQIHDVLVAHLCKLSISPSGAGLLSRDLVCYTRVVCSSHLQPVQDKWAELRQLADLFFVGPEHIKAVINDSGRLSAMAAGTKQEQAYLLAFIQARADFSDNKKKILATLQLQEHSDT